MMKKLGLKWNSFYAKICFIIDFFRIFPLIFDAQIFREKSVLVQKSYPYMDENCSVDNNGNQ